MALPQVLAESVFAKLPLLVSPSTCSGRTYMITGGNHGLGLETARHLVRASAACVILTVRRMAAGEEAKANIERSTGRTGVVELWSLDLASYGSMKAFANKLENEIERIDGFIANAGVWMDRWETAEGMELTVQVNVISTMLLSVLIMPQLIASARKFGNEPKLVFTGSALGFVAEKDLAKCGKTDVLGGLNDQKRANIAQRYALTKLVQMYAVRELAAICPVERTGVTINTIAPGVVSTGLGSDTSNMTKAATAVIKALFARTAEQGSRTILHGVVAGRDSHGKMLSACKIKEHWVPKWMSDGEGKKLQKQIWSELVEVMETQQPGCTARLA
ncbi:NAD(P)-binding protein [Bimuria novae-zelandiae CBS 107.79]|uniref:NAD(P)-binding protein n=1 Tax=Bimuria novae-zelandiae CBS 107.79 TaxID=1447943 RepID=A0A6A5UNU8_9PLEO|nr:NAD(P)-binding protein [Bimuria novae-zelandiae CBS 107.79]